MASLSAIRDNLARVIDKHTAKEIHTYGLVEDFGEVPAVIVEPEKSDFEEAMQRGMDTWTFNLFILCSSKAGAASGQELLDQLISGAGPNSIRQVLYDHSDLGLDETIASCLGMVGYGGKFEWAKVPHVGAILKVQVRTSGRE